MTDEHGEHIHQVRVVDKRGGSDAPLAEEPAAVAESEELDEIVVARAEAAQYLDDLLRLKAEFENYRKRTAKEQATLIERATASVVERLLSVLDNFELALMAADRTKDYEAMVRGVEMVYGELRDLLRKEGLERIDAVHEPFDPERHEAVMHEAGDDGDGDQVVIDEMRPGYMFGGRVLRPAMVKVGKQKQ